MIDPLPDFETFSAQAEGQTLVPVYCQLTGDSLSPVEAFRRLDKGEHSFLFESVVGGERIGRYSFIGSNPFLTIQAAGNEVKIYEQGATRKQTSDDPLALLGELLSNYRMAPHPQLPRFCGGAVGYAGYDVVRYAENLPNAPEDDRQVPDMLFGLYDRMVIFDHINKTVFVVVLAAVESGDLKAAYKTAGKTLTEICYQLEHNRSPVPPEQIRLDDARTLDWKSNYTQDEFEGAVETCKEYIRAGDIFQVVLSQRLELETRASELAIYRALRVVNPSPFMFLVKSPEVTLVGSSPEIMTRVEHREMTVRPLAGTRPRGATADEDVRLEKELLADPKERAEHVMLVDLARNDIGRVAEYNSIEIKDIMVVERYSHVMHITSNVTGQLKQELSALDALRAALPAGTVSGAPKVRAMEIIDELERHRRGPYAGAVGYIDFTGDMDTCIALRTLVKQGKKVYVQAGAGLVADSVPATEYEETLNKAKGLLKAIAVAHYQLSDHE
ncbi:anthranilate synthase component I [Rubinisphaera margarita]|uniref:anthranilate synthase component I n=1 Tax=Rubinisphaera margarita TaxID=2909586 RepID=UPI001EE90A74|nr:anthranilate synthase component I [Rubinisphaera margarita]MCG6154719.1 anthranilate synthase component I [Rubinisphaera margarita]